MTKLDDLKSLLMGRGLWAKKSLGQNFLIDQVALDTIVNAAELCPSDRVVEVGPGTGFLTEQLIAKAAHVTSVELDPNMIGILKNKFSSHKNFDLVHSDILRFPVPEGAYKVVANIPYYITSPLLKHFLQSNNRPSLMVILVQKEVAEKICGKGKSLITIETQLFGESEIIATVKAAAFYPSPKVDSAILKISVHEKPLVNDDQLKEFLRLVKFGFTQKRKKLSNGLAAGLRKESSEVRKMIEAAGLSSDIRPEELTIDDWKRLLKEIN